MVRTDVIGPVALRWGPAFVFRARKAAASFVGGGVGRSGYYGVCDLTGLLTGHRFRSSSRRVR